MNLSERLRDLTLLSPLLILPAAGLGVWIASRTYGLSSMALTEGQAAFWDLLLKAIAGVITLTGGLLAISKYLYERVAANRTALIEANKPFSERQQSVYFELCSNTAIVANRRAGDPVRNKAEAKFWELFWGALPMVADDQVSFAVDRFAEALDFPQEEVNLRNRSMDLARACRRSLGFVKAIDAAIVNSENEADAKPQELRRPAQEIPDLPTRSRPDSQTS